MQSVGQRRAALCRCAGHNHGGVTLIELLCVLCIISILASLLLPAVFRAYHRVKGMAEETEAPQIARLLVRETRSYCASHPQYGFGSKSELADKCGLASKCREWLQASTTEFVPFNYLYPSNAIVLAVYVGRNHSILYAFTKGDLSSGGEER